MYKTFFIVMSMVCLFTSCKKEQNPFEISKQNIGFLTDSTQIKDLKSIYVNDSIVRFIGGDEFTGTVNNVDIFEKGGKKLLTLSPKQALDSTATIASIHIFDERYKTDKNISVLSTFKDIKNKYQNLRIINSINSIVVAVDEINAAFTIDKKELPANLRFDMDLKFEVTHIPDEAKLKYFFIHWNN